MILLFNHLLPLGLSGSLLMAAEVDILVVREYSFPTVAHIGLWCAQALLSRARGLLRSPWASGDSCVCSPVGSFPPFRAYLFSF